MIFKLYIQPIFFVHENLLQILIFINIILFIFCISFFIKHLRDTELIYI